MDNQRIFVSGANNGASQLRPNASLVYTLLAVLCAFAALALLSSTTSAQASAVGGGQQALTSPTRIGCLELDASGACLITATPGKITPTATPTPTITPTATPTPAGLFAVADPAISLAKFPPGAEFILQFSDPVAPESADPPLYTFPWVEGAFTWDESRTRLTFVAAGGLADNTLYHFYANPALSAVNGKPLYAAQEWLVQTGNRPKVINVVPEAIEAAELQPEIVISFSEAMLLDEVTRALSVEPELDYSLEGDGKRILLKPQEALEPGQTYRFQLASSATDIYGSPLAEDFAWQYTVPGLEIRVVTIPPASDMTRSYMLESNYPLDRASLEQAIAISPTIAISVTVDSAFRFRLQPVETWPFDAPFEVRFTGALTTTNAFTFPPPEPIAFRTLTGIRSVYPSESDYFDAPRKSIEISFATAMDKESVENAFSISPTLPGEAYWIGDDDFRFRPTEDYQSGIEYTVTLLHGALNSAGQAILTQPYTWRFTRYPAYYRDMSDTAFTFGQYGPNVQVVDADGRRAVHYVSGELPSITYELYALEVHEFVQSFADDFAYFYWYEPMAAIEFDPADLAYTWEGFNAAGGISELIIPAEVPPGLYILNARVNNKSKAQLFISLSRNQLIVKRTGDDVTVWATDINGAPLSGVEIRIYNEAGVKLREGYADDNGIYRTTLYGDADPLLALAHTPDGDFSICGFTGSWGSYRSATLPAYNAYIYTDRPIYRPGQTVYFKALLRQDDDAQYSLPPESAPVTVTIRDANENLLQTYLLSTNALGSVNGSFTLAEGAMLGNYSVETSIGGAQHSQVFKVQEYRKPEIELALSLDKTRLVEGQSISLTVQADYFFGKPAAGIHLNYKEYTLEPEYCFYDENCLPEDQPYVWYQNWRKEAVAGITDDNGAYTFALTPGPLDWRYGSNDWSSSLRWANVAFEVSLDDDAERPTSATIFATIYNAAEQISLDRGDWLKETGLPFTLKATVETIDNLPVAERALQYSVSPLDSTTWEFNAIQFSGVITSNEQGEVAIPITLENPGYYRIRVLSADALGNEIETFTYIYTYSPGNPWYRSSRDSLSVTVERDSYQPYQTAQIIVESTVSGPALVTFEREQVHRALVVQLTAPLTILDLPLLPEDAPNTFLTVSQWQPKDSRQPPPPTVDDEGYYYNVDYSRADSELIVDRVKLEVQPADKELLVEITTDEGIYAPGSEATITVTVSNWQGQPVPVELSLAVVDEAIFSLSDELSAPILEGFYAARKHRVASYNSMAPTRILIDNYGGGRGGGDNPVAMIQPRAEFADTAAWLPALQTGADGVVTATITLPDNLTSWRITAKAHSAQTTVGEAATNIVTQKAVVVRPQLPAALVVGDETSLTAVIHNYTPEPLTLDVTLSGESAGLRLLTPVTQTVLVSANQSVVAGWAVVAESAGGISLTFRTAPSGPDSALAARAGYQDAVLLPLSIAPLSVPESAVLSGAFSGTLELPIYLPPHALETSFVEIQLNRTLASSLLEGLDYLTGYPYGCVEQTMSRALPNAVVGRAYALLGVDDAARKAALEPLIQASIQRLYGYQHYDGGWGWWYDDKSDAYQTAWVVFGLETMRQAGYPVEPNVIGRGVEYLRDYLNDMDPKTRAFALYSMALAGQGDLPATQKALESVASLDAFSQAALALAFESLGEHATAVEIVQLLENSANREAGMAFWNQPHGDGHYYNKTMASTTRATALALDALARIEPQNPLVPQVVAWLMSQRRAEGWGSTNETSFTILALSDYVLTALGENPESGYRIELNGMTALSGTMSQWGETVTLRLPAAEMQPGANDIRLEQSGSGQLYYRAVQRLYLETAEISAAGVIAVKREFFPESGRTPRATFTEGEIVRVRLTIDIPRAGSYLIVEDHLPAGLEAVNGALNTSVHDGSRYYYDTPSTWKKYGYNQKEIRGSQVSFFITEVDAGQWVIEYRAIALHSGEFIALPTSVYAMYDPSLWGRSSSARLMVAE